MMSSHFLGSEKVEKMVSNIKNQRWPQNKGDLQNKDILKDEANHEKEDYSIMGIVHIFKKLLISSTLYNHITTDLKQEILS